MRTAPFSIAEWQRLQRALLVGARLMRKEFWRVLKVIQFLLPSSAPTPQIHYGALVTAHHTGQVARQTADNGMPPSLTLVSAAHIVTRWREGLRRCSAADELDPAPAEKREANSTATRIAAATTSSCLPLW